MDEISIISHVDENKNSLTLDYHTPENVEFPVSPLTSGVENIAPELVFERPTSPQSNISEVNSNIAIQSPKKINSATFEIEGGIAKVEIASLHDTSKESISEETMVSYKSCNGSFLGDVNNSIKSLNGSFIMEMSPNKSVESLLDKTIQSSSLQTKSFARMKEAEKNVNHVLASNNASPELLVKDVSFSEDKSDNSVKNILEATVELPLPNSVDNVQGTVENKEIVLNNASLLLSKQSISFSGSNLTNDASLSDQKYKDELPAELNNDDLNGELADFSAPRLEDAAVNILQSNKTTHSDSKDVHDLSNLMCFSNMIQDFSDADEISCKMHIQIDSPAEVDNIDKNANFQTIPQFGEPSGDPTSTIIPETFDGVLGDDPFNLQDIEFNKSPPDDFVFKVPKNPVSAEKEEFTDAVQFFKDPSSFKFLESIKTSPTEDNALRNSLYIKFDPLHSSFPRNPKSTDVLQALQSKTGIEPNMQCLNMPARESLGNILISFDSPRKTGSQEPKSPILMAPAKLFTEEELQQHLNMNELINQEMLLKKQREMEKELARKEKEMMTEAEEKDRKIAQLENHLRIQCVLLEEFVDASGTASEKNNSMLRKTETREEENAKLKKDVKSLAEDLQSVETTFADFHKRYEQCKSMLKTLKSNEELLKTKLKEQEKAYQELQDNAQETLEKANLEVTTVKKTSEAQTTVLKAQLKKADFKISNLESVIKQIKIENCQLGGICDDLMEKVGKS